MRKREKLEDYEVFYMELPHADYLDDIEIQDEYDNPNYDQLQGLSDTQVSEIAKDSLAAAEKHDPGKENSAFNESTPQKS